MQKNYPANRLKSKEAGNIIHTTQQDMCLKAHVYFFFIITIKTAKRIVIIPTIILGVSCSWKTTTPKNIAVRGSRAPRTAAAVEPIIFIDIVIAIRETIVGRIERARTFIQR